MTLPPTPAPKPKWQMPTSDEVQSVLRHVYNATATIVAVLMIVGLSQGDATAIGNVVHAIGDSVAIIIAAISTLIPLLMAAWAAWTASPWARLLRFKKDPDIKQVITVSGTPMAQLANQIPGDKITSAPADPVTPAGAQP